MKVLAIETSSFVASCAVCEDEKVLAKFNVSTGLFHSETLMVLVDELFKISKIKLEEINAVAVSVGPGSFTGLRIGVAAAKGIAMGLNLPCVGVETLKGLCYNLVSFNGTVFSCMDARNNFIYFAEFKILNGVITKTIEDCFIKIEELKEILKGKTENVFLVGDFPIKVFEEIKSYYKNLSLAPQALRLPDAASIGFLAMEKLRLKENLEEDVVPKYVKLSQPEEKSIIKNNKKEEGK